MWTSVYMAQSKEIAKKLKTALENANIVVKILPFGNDEGAEKCYEILVPSSEVEQAHSIIIDMAL